MDLAATGWGNGDFNGDGIVNGDDYAINPFTTFPCTSVSRKSRPE